MRKLSLFAVLIVSIIFAYIFRNEILGQKPKQTFKASHTKVQSEAFPELEIFRHDLETLIEPQQRLVKLIEFAEILKIKIQATQDKALIFEYIAILGEVNKLDPKNKFALLELANLSFESKVFTKAASYYQQYLQLEPEDDQTRSRYASSLVFIEQVDLALQELDFVLSKRPDDFSALAYKTIALVEAGKEEEARETAALALKYAPDQAGKDRLQSYLDSLDQKEFEKYLKTNPITASKYREYQIENETLKLYFEDFPMSAMPEIAKNKFFEKIRTSLKDLNHIKEVVFLDQVNQTELDRIQVNVE